MFSPINGKADLIYELIKLIIWQKLFIKSTFYISIKQV